MAANGPVIHSPSRPDWHCLACAEPWPCLIRKRQLKYLYQNDLTALVSHLTGYLAEAQADLPGADPSRLADRFAQWCHWPLSHCGDQPQDTLHDPEPGTTD